MKSVEVKLMRALPLTRVTVIFALRKVAEVRSAPSILIAPAPVNVAPSKSPYSRCAFIRSSSPFVLPIVRWAHLIWSVALAARSFSISAVHGCAGGDGGSEGDGDEEAPVAKQATKNRMTMMDAFGLPTPARMTMVDAFGLLTAARRSAQSSTAYHTPRGRAVTRSTHSQFHSRNPRLISWASAIVWQ